MQPYLSLDGLRATLVLMFAILQIATAYWPQWRGWPQTIASRSARLRNPLVPIDWAFAIWGPIFLACVAFGVWQLMPSQLADPLSRQIGWLAIAAFGANVIWQVHVPRRDLDLVSVVVLAIELALVLAILFWLTGAAAVPPGLTGTRFWLVAAPFQLLAGWVSAAVFVNTASALLRAGIKTGPGLAAALLLAASALAAGVAGLTGSRVYAAAVCWALLGVFVANLRRPDGQRSIAWLAVLMVPVVIGPAV